MLKVCIISEKKYAETDCLLLKIPRIKIFQPFLHVESGKLARPNIFKTEF